MSGAEWTPDFGPAQPHESAGATVIGARMPLIAYNINLNTDRIDVTGQIDSDPTQQRRPALREGYGGDARRSPIGAGLDESHQLREDADLPRASNW